MNESVTRALRILTLLAEGPKSPSEIARQLDVHRSTALRLLRSMVDEGYVRAESPNRYRIGAQVIALAEVALESLDIRMVAHAHLEPLRNQIGQTVHLAMYDNERAVYVDKLNGYSAVRLYSRLGRPIPLHCTAVGKALLAFRPEEEILRIVEALSYERHTPNTVSGVSAMLRELDRTRQRGYSIDDAEHEESVRCIGAPIREANGAVTAAVSITTVGFTTTALLEFVPNLLEATRVISMELGWGVMQR